MDVKFCGQCGSPIQENSAFCSNCGWKVQSGVLTPPQEIHPNGVGGSQYVGQQFYQQPQPIAPVSPTYTPPVQKKSGCGGCLLITILVLVLLGAGILFGGKLIKTQLEKWGVDTSGLNIPELKIPNVTLPGMDGKFKASDIAGPYYNEFETLSATVNGEFDSAYAGMIGQKSNMNSTLVMTDDENGSMAFSGSPYGVDINVGMAFTVKGDQIEVTHEDASTSSVLKYTGTIEEKDGVLTITGQYETTYKDPYSSSVVVISGNWTAYSSKGKVSKDLDTSKAKKETTIEELQGTWSGTFIYARIDNLDEMPDVTEEDKEMARSILGQTLSARCLFEGNNLLITIEDPTGGESDLEDMPPINLENGVFTSAMQMTDSEGTGQMNLSGVVYEEGGQLKIHGILSMEMAFVKGTTLEIVIELDVIKD